MRFKVVHHCATRVIPARLQVCTAAAVLALVGVTCECLSPKCLPMFGAVKRAICLRFYTAKITLQKYTYVFVDENDCTYILPIMKPQVCHNCGAVCNSLSKDCPSCGTSLTPKTAGNYNPMPFIAAVCASYLMIGLMILAAA